MCEAWDEGRAVQSFGATNTAMIISFSNEDSLIGYRFNFMQFLNKHDINFCPWCGAKLPDDNHE